MKNIKIKNSEVGAVNPSYGMLGILSDIANLPMSGEAAMKLVNIIRKFENLGGTREEAKKMVMINHCVKADGKPDIKGGQYQFEPDVLEKVQGFVNDIDNSEVEVIINPLTDADIASMNNISPAALLGLEKLRE
jgi:hypothetical protein